MDSKSIVLMTVQPPEKSFVPVQEKRIPLEIATLIGHLSEKKYEVSFVDNYLKYNDWECVVENDSVRYVGLYLSIECWGEAKKYLEKLKQLKFDGESLKFKMVAFGPFAKFYPELIPDFVDYIVPSNIEYAFIKILEENVSDRVVDIKALDNIDDLNDPKWDYFIPTGNALDCEYDLTNLSLGDIFPVFNLLTVHGCQHKLAYCPSSSLENNTYSLVSASKLVEQIKFLVKTYDAKGIKLIGYDFIEDKDRVIEFCTKLKDEAIDIAWECSIKPGLINRETLALMKNAGCKAINIYVESGSQRVLDYINADFTVDKVKVLSKIVKSLGIHLSLNVCYGWPTETKEERDQTRTLLEECKADFVNKRIYLGIPKSKLCDEALNSPHRIDESTLVIPSYWDTIAKEFINKSFYSGNYADVLLVSNPIPFVVFYKKKDYIEEKVNFIDNLPLKTKVYLYGAGKLAKSLIKKYKMEESDIKGVFDGNLSKSGRFRPTKFTIYHETEIKKLAPHYIFITMASREDSIKVKKAIINDINIDKKPEIYSMFYEEV